MSRSQPVVGMIVLLLWTAAVAAAPAPDAVGAVYDTDPHHLWNRLYRAIAVRAEGGQLYGEDNTEPFREPFDDPKALAAVLDEFLTRGGAAQFPEGDVRRALLLSDLWAAFDLAASPAAGPDMAPIRSKLARAIKRLALSRSAVARLPNNYAQAVQSRAFASDFDAAAANHAFLPADLFDPTGPWVELRDPRGYPLASMHVSNVSGRSVFRVFIRCPGGRASTLAYLSRLNLYPTPWELKPAEIATSYPDNAKVRWDPLRFDPNTPQLPEGTIVALVRQMMVLDDRLEPVPTSITQSVQFRVYRKVGDTSPPTRENFPDRQLVYELAMRRRALLAGISGGLRALTPDEAEYQLAMIPMGGPRAALLRGPVVLSTCIRCHSSDGVFSVNSYGRGFSNPPGTTNPQLLPATDPGVEAMATVEWKKRQYDFGLLRGLLEGF